MSAQPQYTDLTFGEVRDWAILLRHFTAGDLAHEMGVDFETGRKAVNALILEGICRATGDEVDGRYGYEPIIEYVPPPPGPTKREPTGPDPVQTAISQAGRVIVERGTPVRIRTRRDTGRALSTPGSRQIHKNRERNYERMQEAKRERAELQKRRAQKEPKWKRKK